MSTILTVGITAVAAAAAGGVLAYRAGVRDGRTEMLDNIRTELDKVVTTYTEDSKRGEMRQTIELPGLLAVRRMFGTALTLLLVMFTVSSCTVGERLGIANGSVGVFVDSLRHVACYTNPVSGGHMLSCLALDSLNKAAK